MANAHGGETEQFAEALDSFLMHARNILGDAGAISQALAAIARHAAEAYPQERAQLLLISAALRMHCTLPEIAALVARLATTDYGGDDVRR